MKTQVIDSLQCAVCGARVPVAQPLSWRCPQANNDDRHHVLHFSSTPSANNFQPVESENPFVRFQELLAWDAFASQHVAAFNERSEFIERLDAKVESVAKVGFRRTPFARNAELSNALGFEGTGGLWVKDETHNVAGSQKARHLFTELLHLVFAEEKGLAPWGASRPELAIASCGNAAIAAATLAASVQWPIRVFVPESVDAVVLNTLKTLGAHVEVCVRQPSDPAGDPCVLRFQECIARGSLPFGVQGTENAWCLDGGRLIGLEILEQFPSTEHLARIFVQVGGGAFASGIGDALRSAEVQDTHLHAVQTEGCSPLARAWSRAAQTGGTLHAGSRWSECMWPWEEVPTSLADGILDDETYDWISICDAMTQTGGFPIVSPESDVVAAFELAQKSSGINVSPTGSAGLAGLMTYIAKNKGNYEQENIAVVFSGVLRS
jgi:threonine dehydratase